MKDVTSRTVKIDDVVMKIAPQFSGTFKSLLSVMEIQGEKEEAKREKLAKATSQQASQAPSVPISSGRSAATKRDPPSPIISESQPMKRQKSGHESKAPSPQRDPPTPDQLTVQADPTYTGDTAYSGDSMASKPEDHTSRLLHEIVSNTESMVSEEFRVLSWARSDYSVEISKT